MSQYVCFLRITPRDGNILCKRNKKKREIGTKGVREEREGREGCSMERNEGREN
jgi:hypothetical protein